jgi:hypothetical protein
MILSAAMKRATVKSVPLALLARSAALKRATVKNAPKALQDKSVVRALHVKSVAMSRERAVNALALVVVKFVELNLVVSSAGL